MFERVEREVDVPLLQREESGSFGGDGKLAEVFVFVTERVESSLSNRCEILIDDNSSRRLENWTENVSYTRPSCTTTKFLSQ